MTSPPIDHLAPVRLSPSVARPWLASAGAWALLALLSAQAAGIGKAITGWPDWLNAFGLTLVAFTPWIVVTALAPRLVARLPVGGLRSWQWVITVLAAGLACGALSLGGSIVALWLGGVERLEMAEVIGATPWWRYLIDALAFAVLVAFAHGRRVERLLQAREAEAQQLRVREAEHAALAAAARLETLRSRVQPHFLFNALNSIIALVRLGRGQAAVDVLHALATLMRLALRETTAQLVPLRDELALTRCYIDVEQVRLGERLCAELCVAGNAAAVPIPSLVLQPLVENAIRHGIEQLPSPGHLTIRAAVDDAALIVTIENDGPRLPDGWSLDANAGVGLSLTRDRLAHLYGADHDLRLSSTDHGVSARPSTSSSTPSVMPVPWNELFSGRTRVAIADDEPLARANLRLSLTERPDVEIVGEAANGADTISLVKDTRPDALFLNVRMPAGDAFTVMRDLPHDPPLVIFLTAYEEYALGAFDVRAFDYLVKPCDDQRLTECMERVVATTIERRAARAVTRLRALLEPGDLVNAKADQSRLQVRQAGRTYLVPVSSIRWIDVRGTVLRLHTHDTTYTARSGLARLLEELGPSRFARIHRHAAVNLDCVSELDTHNAAEPVVVLTSGERLRASRREVQRLHGAIARRYVGWKTPE